MEMRSQGDHGSHSLLMPTVLLLKQASTVWPVNKPSKTSQASAKACELTRQLFRSALLLTRRYVFHDLLKLGGI